jgi:hypothetical protein
MLKIGQFLLIVAAIALTVSTVKGMSERLFVKAPGVAAPVKAKPAGLWV